MPSVSKSVGLSGRCESGTISIQGRLFPKLHRFCEQAINAAAEEDRGDRHDVRCHVFPSFGTKFASLKKCAELRASGHGSLTGIERLQRSTDAGDNTIPSSFFARGVLEVKAMDGATEPAREVATTVVDSSLIDGRNSEKRSCHSHVVHCSARRFVIALQITSRRFTA